MKQNSSVQNIERELSPSSADDGGREESCKVYDLTLVKQRLMDCLMEGGGDLFGLSYEKYVSRSNCIEVSEKHPGKFIVAVERHRAIAGCAYRPGLPMSAFETYQMRLLFDPSTNELSDYDEISQGKSINAYALAVEHAGYDWRPVVLKKEDWTSMRRVELSISNLVFESESLVEARAVLEKQLRSLDHESVFDYLDLSSEERYDYLAEYEEAFVNSALDGFDENWDNPELIED